MACKQLSEQVSNMRMLNHLTKKKQIKKIEIMARPIRNTPILMGKDAAQFVNAADNYPDEFERQKERMRLEANVNRFHRMLANLPQ